MSFEISVNIYQTTRRSIPGDSHLRTPGNLRSDLLQLVVSRNRPLSDRLMPVNEV
jgi:hypothetical protein